ncbi:HAD family hydrolase [Thiorhodococcus mannitoliphagus]|uniref:HAD family hydrolase n=1 Tax=Thiorhodococcus mannitoliphagus TaxID=329406 RepID=A0A6P1DXH2_9GAMM|nr:HAD family hydrolase [Thiorhodococcus mannitoliphagus]NEX21783.1 HAD family hydrolase [Thiorhodococcus mannitoliphagus]
MYGFKALIFDVDGTVADTERDGHRPAFNAAFAEVGLDWHWDPALYGELLAVAGGKERIRYFMMREGIRLDPGADEDAFVADLHRRKTRHYLAMLSQGAIPLRPGVLRLWREARAAGIRLAIATTTTPENVVALLAHAGEPSLADWFDVIAAGDSVPAKKPAPDIYHLVLEQLGLEASDCIAFEDSDNGARAALDAGLSCLVITTNAYTAGQDFGAAPLILDQLGEPSSPPRLAVGDLAGRDCVDLQALERLHHQVTAAGGASS